MLTCGLDIGSVVTKAVIVDNGKVLAYSIQPTGTDILKIAEKVTEEVLQKADVSFEDIGRFIATGYGRNSIPFASRQITEITCCARGVHSFYPGARTVIDMGGQDTKVIQLDDKGRVAKFALNDKCAAGTGKFLEVAAQTLGVRVEELGDISLESRDRSEISSMCTVFAQSEIVSLIVKKTAVEDIIAGLHRAIVNRVFGLACTVGIKEGVVMVGGVAKNSGVVRAMEEKLGYKLYVPEEPQITVAIGAALLA